MDKGDIGGIREVRKEDECRYICGLLSVASLPLLGGLETPHKGQRKSPSRKHVAHDAANRVAEAERLNKSPEIENQELRRHNEELKTATQTHCDREEELVQTIQQALEEHESMTPRISEALYRRLEHSAPNIIKELQHAINPFGNVHTRFRHSPSDSPPDPLSRPPSSFHLSDIPTPEGPVISQSPGSRMAAPQVRDRRQRIRQLLSHDSIALDTQQQHQRESSLTQNKWAVTSPSGPDSHPPQGTTTPMLPSSAHLISAFARISTDFLSDDWNSPAFQPQNNMAEDSALYNMDFTDSQVLNDIFHPQEPNIWDDSLFTGLLSNSVHGGDGVNDSFLSDFLAS
ncbi:hypothetical protein Q7P36_008627 [Cladosporium allicinum]